MDNLKLELATLRESGVLSVWIIYEHPSDFPHAYVARKYEIRKSEPVATADFFISPDLIVLQKRIMSQGFVCAARSFDGEPGIIEIWVHREYKIQETME